MALLDRLGPSLDPLRANLAGLGARRLILLGVAFALVAGAVIAGAAMLGAPTHETIYAKLERRDAAAIARELSSIGIPHTLGTDGASVSVPVARVAEARMALAERGLPQGEGSGYELFDQVGSLGLTSFMQEVTRLRALEGEIARTIRAIDGVTNARVHLVMGDAGSFRRERREPSASIVISARSEAARGAAPAIRHLVAAAVPGLTVAGVTVLDDRGSLLVAGEDLATTGLDASLTITGTLEKAVEDKVARAIEPFLGAANFRVSAKARIDTDREEVRETTFDPDGRVEREVRVERETRRSDQRQADDPVTIEQDLPDTGDLGGSGDASSESDERRRETTSYEINTRTTSRVREAYRLDRLTVAIVVNRERVAALAGPNADDAAIAEAVSRVRQLARSAAGMDDERGDVIEVTAVDFAEEVPLEAGEGPGAQFLARNAATLIAAFAFIVGLAVLALVLRPVLAGLAEPRTPGTALVPASDAAAGNAEAPSPSHAAERVEGPAASSGEGFAALAAPSETETPVVRPDPAKRLARLVELDERRTALVLRRWINEETA